MRGLVCVLLVCVTLSGLVTSMEAEFQALQGTSAEAAAIMEQAVAAVNPASQLSQGASQLHEIAHAFRKARETHGVGRAHSHKERRNRFHLISAAVHALQAMTHDEKVLGPGIWTMVVGVSVTHVCGRVRFSRSVMLNHRRNCANNKSGPSSSRWRLHGKSSDPRLGRYVFCHGLGRVSCFLASPALCARSRRPRRALPCSTRWLTT